MSSASSSRRQGVLLFWHLSEHGGFGKVIVLSTRELFFIHRKMILSGEPIVGSPVSFIPLPPLEGAINWRASEAIISKPAKVGV
jgi:hypothetical protein